MIFLTAAFWVVSFAADKKRIKYCRSCFVISPGEWIMEAVLVRLGISLFASVVTLAGGHFIYGPKQRVEQKAEFNKKIGEKKA